MRAAQLDANNTVINYAEVSGFDGVQFIDPLDSVIGSTWDGSAYVHPVPLLPTEADYVAAVQNLLDSTAQTRHYDSILSACTYAGSTVTKFHDEGVACLNWRDAVWAKCYDLMAQVQAGTLAQPTVPELLAMLPAMSWPA